MTIEVAIKILESGSEMPDYPHTSEMLDEACDMAVAALRAQAEAEKNEPLTLDKLQEMNGEPVWVCPPSMEDEKEWSLASGEWALVDTEYELCRTVSGGLCVFENNGKTWMAYRRKPDEGKELPNDN